MTPISSVQGLLHLFPVPDLFRGRKGDTRMVGQGGDKASPH